MQYTTGMKIDILTLFPGMFVGPFDTSMLKKAQDKGLVEINIHNLRDWAEDERKTVDDRPYSGGVGMIMRVDIIDRAITSLRENNLSLNTKVVLLDAAGKYFTQSIAKKYSKTSHLILIAGHYEGVDYRVHQHLVDEVISIGDYVLTGGEIPAMVLTDSIVRLLPGVLAKTGATENESFSLKTSKDQRQTVNLEYPQYTRPEVYRGWKVPKILLSGNHKEIEEWKKDEALKRTKKNRPNLIIGP